MSTWSQRFDRIGLMGQLGMLTAAERFWT
ncbi:MAG: hypothetical protein RI920_457, partial [Pseudomonadota bacterium]